MAMRANEQVGWRRPRGAAFGHWVLLCVLGGCSARVAGGLDELRANEAVALLEERGIATTKELEGGGSEPSFAIDVARGDLGVALRTLEAAALPRRVDRGIAETYSEPSLVPSATEERARYHAAVAGELARTIQRIDGVVDVRVHVAAPESHELGLDGPVAPARASVLVTTRPRASIDTNAVRSIVVGAVDGLSPETVAVVLLPAPAAPSSRGRLAQVGPFRLAPGSARLLSAVLFGSILVHIGTSAVLVLLVLQRRKLGDAAAGSTSTMERAPLGVTSPQKIG